MFISQPYMTKQWFHNHLFISPFRLSFSTQCNQNWFLHVPRAVHYRYAIQFNSIQFYSCSIISTTGKVTSQIKSCTSHRPVIIKYKQISITYIHYKGIYEYINSNHQNITSIKHTLHRPKHKPKHGNLWGHFIKMILSPLKIWMQKLSHTGSSFRESNEKILHIHNTYT
jgi:hypothetical protein